MKLEWIRAPHQAPPYNKTKKAAESIDHVGVNIMVIDYNFTLRKGGTEKRIVTLWVNEMIIEVMKNDLTINSDAEYKPSLGNLNTEMIHYFVWINVIQKYFSFEYILSHWKKKCKDHSKKQVFCDFFLVTFLYCVILLIIIFKLITEIMPGCIKTVLKLYEI